MSIDGRLNYRQWLRGEDWSLKRSYCLRSGRCVCQSCGKVDFHNDVHHIWYRGRWNETHYYRDLRVLCRSCHEDIHALTNPKKYKTIKEAKLAYLAAIQNLRKKNAVAWKIFTDARREATKLEHARRYEKAKFKSREARKQFYLARQLWQAFPFSLRVHPLISWT